MMLKLHPLFSLSQVSPSIDLFCDGLLSYNLSRDFDLHLTLYSVHMIKSVMINSQFAAFMQFSDMGSNMSNIKYPFR